MPDNKFLVLNRESVTVNTPASSGANRWPRHIGHAGHASTTKVESRGKCSGDHTMASNLWGGGNISDVSGKPETLPQGDPSARH